MKVGNCIFICVYFPVYRNSSEYASLVSNLIGIIESVVTQNMRCPVIIGGDLNLEFFNGVTQCHSFNKFISSANLHRCETTDTTKHTFCCETRNASSLIDHFLVSKCLTDKVDACYTVDSGLNFSDHLPLGMHCVLPLSYLHLLSYKTASGKQIKKV